MKDGSEAVRGEDDFLRALEAPRINIGPLIRYAEAAGGQSAVLLELLADACQERGQLLDTLTVLEKYCSVSPQVSGEEIRQRLFRLLGGGEKARRMLSEAGCGSEAGVTDCLQRLKVLLRLKPGVLCRDTTWGVGEIVDVDFIHGELEVDFENRTGHRMSLGYASQRLQLLPEGHFWAEYYRRGKRIADLIRDDPAALVKWIIADCGPMTPRQVREALQPFLSTNEEWRNFWFRARDGLKAAGDIHVPARLDEAMRQITHTGGGELMRRISGAADEDLMKVMEDLRRKYTTGLPQSLRAAVLERVREALSDGGKPLLERIRLVLVLRDVVGAEQDVAQMVDWEALGGEEQMASLLAGTPSRQLRWLIRELLAAFPAEQRGERAHRLLKAAAKCTRGVLEAAVQEFVHAELEDVVMRFMQRASQSADCPAVVIAWMLLHSRTVREWGAPTAADLVRLAVNRVSSAASGLRAAERRYLIRGLLEDAAIHWLVETTPDEELHDIVHLIHSRMGWVGMEKGEILGKIIKLRPSAGEALRQRQPVQATVRRTTSWRSYRQKQRQLEILTSKEIPRAASEIARARSYGDLRENYEYKAAKEHQALLMRRREELEKALTQVTPTDFADVEPEIVAPGVEVELEFEDGDRRTVAVLGVWDHDEKLGIISCEAPLAQALLGHRPGEMIELPRGMERKSLKILAVRRISARVRDWIRGEEGYGAKTE